jgi:transposase
MESFIMRAKDQLKLEVVGKVMDGRLERFDGQKLLGVSERTLRRYLARYSIEGVSFVKHKNSAKKPKNKISNDLKAKIQALLQDKYFDFNVAHFQEKIFEELGCKVKYETLRKWCHEVHLVKRAKRRRSKPRYKRQRMSQEGLMLQMDGSHHRWFFQPLFSIHEGSAKLEYFINTWDVSVTRGY